jgi:hypothetical protein
MCCVPALNDKFMLERQASYNRQPLNAYIALER